MRNIYVRFLFCLILTVGTLPQALGQSIDAALNNGNVTYFFQGAQYYRLNGDQVQDGYPVSLPGGWRGLPDAFLQGIDAAFYHPVKKRIYLFRADQYVRIRGVTVEEGYPKPISEWRKLPNSFREGIDAAIYRGGYSYFFKGNEYVRIQDITVQSGYPQDLPGGWELPRSFVKGVDAAFHQPSPNRNYFFSGSSYARLSDVKLDSNYPRETFNWKGLKEKPLLIDLYAAVVPLDRAKYTGPNLATKSLNSSNSKACADLCIQQEGCTAFTFQKKGAGASTAMCYLKKGSGAQPQQLSDCCVSGVIDKLPTKLDDFSLSNYTEVVGKAYKSIAFAAPPRPRSCGEECAKDPKCGLYALRLKSQAGGPSCDLYRDGKLAATKSAVFAGYKTPVSNDKSRASLVRFPGKKLTPKGCATGIVDDVISSLCKVGGFPGFKCDPPNPEDSWKCNTTESSIPLSPSIAGAMFIPENTAVYSKTQSRMSDGKRLGEGVMCALRELSPDFPYANGGPVVSEFRASIPKFGDLSFSQRLGYLDFDADKLAFSGYRTMDFCAPIVGCFDSVAQDIKISLRKQPLSPKQYLNTTTSPILINRVIDGYYVLDVHSETSKKGVRLVMNPGFTIATPFGPVTVTPAFEYTTRESLVTPPFKLNSERTIANNAPASPLLVNAYGVDDAIAFPYIGEATGARGWRSQVAFGDRDPREFSDVWNGLDKQQRPDFDLKLARNGNEHWPSTSVSASARIAFPDKSEIEKYLPPGLVSDAVDVDFEIYITPKARAAFSSQFNIVNSTMPLETQERSPWGDFYSELWMANNAANAFGFSITTGVDLNVSIDFGLLGDVEVIDWHPSWPINFGEGPNFTSVSPAETAFFSDSQFNTYKTKLGSDKTKASAYLKQCLSKEVPSNPQPAPKPKPAKPGDANKLLDNEFIEIPCNICVYVDNKVNGLINDVARPATAKKWQCDAPGKTGCMDMCSLNVNSGAQAFKRSPDKDLIIPGPNGRPNGEICYQNLTLIK